VLIPGYGVGSDFVQIDGKAAYGPMTDDYRKFLEMVSTWYSEGLIDKDFMTRRHFYLDFGEFLNGSFALYPMVSGFYDTFANAGMKITALPYAKLNEGDKRYINSGSAESTLSGSTGAITTNCKDPETLAKWFDYLYSEDGSRLASYGVEGQTYTLVNEKPVFTDLILKNKDNLTVSDAKNAYTFAQLFPFLVQTERENAALSEGAIKATEIWDTDWDLSKSRSIQGDLTADESAEYSAKYNDINTFVTEFKTQVISGAKKLDDNTWNEFVNQLKSMGIDRCIELRQAALDRFNNR
jgi:putative aldouronate transport system substrate-binding protein